MTGTGFEHIVDVYRGDVVESVHAGCAVVARADGAIVDGFGDPGTVTYPRSALKFIQALELVETGAAEAMDLDDRHLALACASHLGEDFQVSLVRDWLGRLGLDEEALACGPTLPGKPEAAEALLRAGGGPARAQHNCSGKHAGFLTVCRHLGHDCAGYHLRAHPVQKRFVDTLSEFTGTNADTYPWGVDGCALPAPALPLSHLAVAMARFADPAALGPERAAAVRRITGAVARHPEYTRGRGDLSHHLMWAAKGRVLVKIGAEGNYVATLPGRGLGLALKIADGAARAAEVALCALIARLLPDADDDLEAVLARFRDPPVLNSRGDVVGRIVFRGA